MAASYALFAAALDVVVLALEAAAAFVILVAAVVALAEYVRRTLRRERRTEPERGRFAHSLLLALDFTIGGDVLKIALRPDLDTVIVVGIIVLVRILLTFVLEYELRRAEERETAGRT